MGLRGIEQWSLFDNGGGGKSYSAFISIVPVLTKSSYFFGHIFEKMDTRKKMGGK